MKNRIDLMINKNCNIDCLFCYHHGFQDTSQYDFSEAKIKSTLFYGKTQWFKELYISGGEPTISSNFKFSVEIWKKYGYSKIKVMTNGLQFSDKEYCREMKQKWLTHLAISMHGYDRKTFEFHANVEWIYKKFMTALLYAWQFFDVDINIVVTKQNIRQLSKHLQLLLKFWYKRVHLQHVVPNSEENVKLLPSNEQVQLYINDCIEKFEKQLDISLEFFPYCLIDKKQYLWKFSFENDFVTNNPSMFDNWSEGIFSNKVLKEECTKCKEKEYCNGFWL